MQARHLASRVKQIGALSIELMFTLLVSALAASAGYMASMRAADANSAGMQGESIQALRTAANKLVMNNYAAYQAGQAITVNAINLPAGNGAGQADNFTTAQLSAMDLGVNNAQTNGSYKSLNDATYQFTVNRTAACAVTPGLPACQVTGLVCLTRPVRAYNAPAGELDAQALGVMFGKLGSNGGASFPGAAATITGADGTWNAPNPMGNVAGIICARFGYGSETDDYVRVADSRDPNLQGGLTINGVIGTSAANHSLQVNGTTNLLGDTIVGDSTANTGNLTVANALKIEGPGFPGNACSNNGAMVWSTVGNTQQMLYCSSGTWIISGMPTSTAGSACTNEGQLAQTLSGTNLICREGAYRPVADAIGRVGVSSLKLYGQNETVDTPTCGGGMTPRMIALGVVSACAVGGGACGNNTGAFKGTITGGVVTITGSDGSVAATDALMAVASICTTYSGADAH